MQRQSPSGQSPGRPPRGLRGLQALVGVLAVLIVVGTAVVIGVVIQRIYARPVAASITPRAAAARPGAAALVLEPGEHIAGIAGAGGVIAVWVQGAGGGKVVLIDPATGAAVVPLTTAASPTLSSGK